MWLDHFPQHVTCPRVPFKSAMKSEASPISNIGDTTSRILLLLPNNLSKLTCELLDLDHHHEINLPSIPQPLDCSDALQLMGGGSPGNARISRYLRFD